MMCVLKQRLFNFEEMFTIAFCVCSYALVSRSNTSYGNSFGKAPLIPHLGGFLYDKMVGSLSYLLGFVCIKTKVV